MAPGRNCVQRNGRSGALAQHLIDIFPPLTVTVTENKQFLDRAVSWVAGEGIGQFIDIGCGMPTAPATHDSARTAVPDARVSWRSGWPSVPVPPKREAEMIVGVARAGG